MWVVFDNIQDFISNFFPLLTDDFQVPSAASVIIIQVIQYSKTSFDFDYSFCRKSVIGYSFVKDLSRFVKSFWNLCVVWCMADMSELRAPSPDSR